MLRGMVGVLVSTMMASSVYAVDMSSNKRFLGVEAGLMQAQGDTLVQNALKGSDTSFGVRLGVQSMVWRTMLSYSVYDNTSDDQNVEKTFLSLDYYFNNDGEEVSASINPYIGVNVGYTNYESFLIDDSGMLYGVQGGVTFNLSESIDVDLGARFALSSGMQNLDHVADVTLGVHYNY